MEPSAHLKHLIKPCSVRGRRIDGMGIWCGFGFRRNMPQFLIFMWLHDWYGREWLRAALSPADGYLALRLPRYSLGGRHFQTHNGATWEEAICFLVLLCRREVVILACWQRLKTPCCVPSISTHPSPLCPRVKKVAARGNALLRNWRKNRNVLLRTTLKE